MKYVIDIPEDMIESLEQGCFGVKYNSYDTATCIMNGKPLSEELEKIKAEVEQCYYNNQPNVDGVIIFKEDINNIFNKHISELKGENKP